MKYDAVIIGAGPGGIAAARRMLEKGKKVLIIEAGTENKSRRCPVLFSGKKCAGCGGKCQIISGVGGACSSVSCGILSKYPAGSGLKKLLGKETLLELEDQVLDWIGDTGRNIFNVVDPDVDQQIYRLSNNEDITIKTYQSLSVEGERFENLMNNLLREIISLGAEIKFNERVNKISGSEGVFRVFTDIGSYFAKNIIIATGRAGNSEMLKLMEEIGVEVSGVGGYIGVRFEDRASKILVELREKVLDPKFKRDKTRLFCFCPEGKVVAMSVPNCFAGKPIDSTEGCVWEGSPWGNFSVQKEIFFGDTAEYFQWEKSFVEKYMKISGGFLIGQSLKTAMNNSAPKATGSSIENRYTCGSVKNLIGEEIVDEMIDFLIDIDNILENQIITDECHIFAPELHLWPKIMVDGYLRAGNGIYVIGDVSGVARGIMQAQVMGLRAADGVLADN
ncbi:MAG: FAD-dependent oxidoreductase [Candidatus Pacebacteria bacterium]|nr:FAD-dependent oxidoreductase [Candidatus Paceibacterota bacterium]